jgi:hypothetical protein
VRGTQRVKKHKQNIVTNKNNQRWHAKDKELERRKNSVA